MHCLINLGEPWKILQILSLKTTPMPLPNLVTRFYTDLIIENINIAK